MMQHARIVGWIIAYNKHGKLHYAPIHEILESQIGFSALVKKRIQTLREVIQQAEGPLFLANRQMFPNLDEYGNLSISPVIHIDRFMVRASDVLSANHAIELIEKNLSVSNTGN